jgi:hypothetical protein
MHVRTEYYTIIHRFMLKERTQLQLLPSPPSPSSTFIVMKREEKEVELALSSLVTIYTGHAI